MIEMARLELPIFAKNAKEWAKNELVSSDPTPPCFCKECAGLEGEDLNAMQICGPSKRSRFQRTAGSGPAAAELQTHYNICVKLTGFEWAARIAGKRPVCPSARKASSRTLASAFGCVPVVLEHPMNHRECKRLL